jgi:hypothetical protein
VTARISPHYFKDAATTHLDAVDPRTQRERWLDGEVVCSSRARRVDGVIERDEAAVSCSRTRMVDTENGPRLVPTPCTPEGDELHEDADDTEPDIDIATRSARVVVATREGTPSITSWDLRRFRANPVVTHLHETDFSIGHADSIEERDGVLSARITIGDHNALAREVFDSLLGGELKAVSPYFVRRADGSAELISIGVVPVPQDPAGLLRRRPKTNTTPKETPMTNRYDSNVNADAYLARAKEKNSAHLASTHDAWRPRFDATAYLNTEVAKLLAARAPTPEELDELEAAIEKAAEKVHAQASTAVAEVLGGIEQTPLPNYSDEIEKARALLAAARERMQLPCPCEDVHADSRDDHPIAMAKAKMAAWAASVGRGAPATDMRTPERLDAHDRDGGIARARAAQARVTGSSPGENRVIDVDAAYEANAAAMAGAWRKVATPK